MSSWHRKLKSTARRSRRSSCKQHSSQRFGQGAQLGPRLVMKKLRGEDVQADVDEYLAKEAQKNGEEKQEKLTQAALKANAAQEKR
jgi:hypothetical protein